MARKGIAADVSRLLTMPDLSATYLLQNVTQGAYDPLADSFASSAAAPFEVRGALAEYALKDVDGSTIKRRDKRLILDARSLPIEPLPGMIAVSAGPGGNYSLVAVKPIAPNGTVIAYECQVRQ